MRQDKLQKAAEQAMQVLRNNLDIFTEKFPASSSTNQFYKQTDNIDWTEGFRTGTYWLSYELTGEESFRKSAEVQVESFYNRIVNKIEIDHHDMGFLYIPSCVAAYRLTGNEKAKDAAIMAADYLISRFQEKGQFIQAWGELGAKDNYRLIIDCLLNVPLLYWATEVTGEGKYRDVAVRHTKTSIQNLVREDYSTYHTYFFDTETGEPTKGITAQGYSDNSEWARGQAWGVYGTALAYRYTQDDECREMFRNVTKSFIEHLPKDHVPYWDCIFKDGSEEPKDSSAAAIAVCGMLEMCENGNLSEEERRFWNTQAELILESLIENYAVKSPKESNGLLLHGVYAKSSPYNTVKDNGVDECNTWGDYFYMEALVRKLKNWTPYW